MPTDITGFEPHATAASGNPVRLAGTARTSSPTAVATAAVAQLMSDTLGKLISLPYANPENFISGATAAITGTGDTQVLAAGATGVRNYVTSIIVTNSHATVNTLVLIKDGTTELFRVWCASVAGTAGPQTVCIHFPVPLRGSTATAINAANITTGSNTYVAAVGYTAP